MFGFMSKSKAEPEHPVQTEFATADTASEASSGFSFLSSPGGTIASFEPSTIQSPLSLLESSSVNQISVTPVQITDVQDVVFEKRAAPGGVVKKKKKTVVGRGRDEVDDDTVPPSSAYLSAPEPKEVPNLDLSPVTSRTSDNDSDASGVEKSRMERLNIHSPHVSPRTVSDNTLASEELKLPPSPPAPAHHSTSPALAPAAVGKSIASATTSTNSIVDPIPVSATRPSVSHSASVTTPQPATSLYEQKCSQLRARADAQMKAFTDCASTVRNSITSLASMKKYIILQMGRAEKDLETAKAEIGAAEREQERLAAAEEFEKAAALGESIVDLTNHISSTQTRIKAWHIETHDVSLSLAEVVEQLAPALGTLMGNLRDLNREQLEERKRLDLEVEMQHSAERDRLDTEAARLALKTDKVKRDEERVAEDSAAIDALIEERLGDVQLRRNELEIKRLALLGEIAELERQLNAKRLEEAANAASAAELDAQIDSVRSNFDRQLSLLQERRARVNTASAECKQDAHDIANGEDLLRAESERLQQLRAQSDAWNAALTADVTLASMLQAAELLLPSSSDGSVSDTKDTSEMTKGSQATVQLQEALGLASLQLATATQLEKSHMDALAALETESRDIEDRLPKIEVEKKGHATARRFKEAAAAAKEQQTLQARKEILVTEVQQTQDAVQASRASVVEATQRRSAAMRALQEVQRNTDIARYLQLNKQGKYLTTIRTDITAVGTSVPVAEKSDPSSCEVRVLAPAELLLDAAIEAIVFEQEAILEVHGLTASEIPGAETFSKAQIALPAVSVESEGATAEPAVSKGEALKEPELDAAAADAAAAERAARISSALEVLSRLDDVAARIDAAVLAEDFEAAAALDEELATENGRLNAQIERLGMDVAALRACATSETSDA